MQNYNSYRFVPYSSVFIDMGICVVKFSACKYLDSFALFHKQIKSAFNYNKRKELSAVFSDKYLGQRFEEHLFRNYNNSNKTYLFIHEYNYGARYIERDIKPKNELELF